MPAQATITLQYGVYPESTDPHTGGYLTGLAANENFLLTVEPGRSFLHRVVYPENANYVYDGYPGVNDAVRLSGFPGLMDSGLAPPVPVQDWEGQPIQFASLNMVAVQVRPKVLYLGTNSSGVLSSTGTEVADGATVTIGGRTYRLKDVMVAAYDVKRHGTSAAITLANLSAAINESGTPGVEYFAGTVAHPDVQASPVAGNTLPLMARAYGVAGDAIATTTTSAPLTFGAPTLTGGSDTSDVLRGLEGTVTIEIDGDLLPGTGTSFKTTVSSPCLFTFATREAWVPNSAGAIRIRFAPSPGGSADAQDINAVATFMFVGTPT